MVQRLMRPHPLADGSCGFIRCQDALPGGHQLLSCPDQLLSEFPGMGTAAHHARHVYVRIQITNTVLQVTEERPDICNAKSTRSGYPNGSPYRVAELAKSHASYVQGKMATRILEG